MHLYVWFCRNNSSLNVMIPRKEGGQWRVTVTAAGVVKEVVAGANFSLNNFSLNNILVVSGNLTWLKCYDIYVSLVCTLAKPDLRVLISKVT